MQSGNRRCHDFWGIALLTTVASFTEPWEAHLFRLRLEAEGIPAVVSHQHHVWANWCAALALGGAKVEVPRSERERALDVERRCRAGEYAADLEAEFGRAETRECPSCGSTDFTSRYSIVRVAMLIFLFSDAAIFPLRRSIHRCRGCGTKWRDPAGLFGL